MFLYILTIKDKVFYSEKKPKSYPTVDYSFISIQVENDILQINGKYVYEGKENTVVFDKLDVDIILPNIEGSLTQRINYIINNLHEEHEYKMLNSVYFVKPDASETYQEHIINKLKKIIFLHLSSYIVYRYFLTNNKNINVNIDSFNEIIDLSKDFNSISGQWSKQVKKFWKYLGFIYMKENIQEVIDDKEYLENYIYDMVEDINKKMRKNFKYGSLLLTSLASVIIKQMTKESEKYIQNLEKINKKTVSNINKSKKDILKLGKEFLGNTDTIVKEKRELISEVEKFKNQSIVELAKEMKHMKSKIKDELNNFNISLKNNLEQKLENMAMENMLFLKDKRKEIVEHLESKIPEIKEEMVNEEVIIQRFKNKLDDILLKKMHNYLSEFEKNSEFMNHCVESTAENYKKCLELLSEKNNKINNLENYILDKNKEIQELRKKIDYLFQILDKDIKE